MRQLPGETVEDWHYRINLAVQKAAEGHWSVSFWSQLDAAVAAETSEGARGGPGRRD